MRSLSLGVLLAMAVFGVGPAAAQIDQSVGSDGVIDISNARGGGHRSKTKDDRGAPAVHMPAPSTTESRSRYDEHLREAATLYHLPLAYLRSVMKVESNFDPRAVSPAGAVGLMQLMPFTAERMMVTDIFDPRQNILGGARYLRILANTFNGDIHLTTAAYNAGEHAVIRYGGIPPYEETQAYVVKVLEAYEAYRSSGE